MAKHPRKVSQKVNPKVKAATVGTPAPLPVDASRLNMGNTYSSPPEHWEDVAFVCRDCGSKETFTAAQQKWWYEDAGGYFFATAIRCRACRAKERERIAEARAASGHAPKNPERG